MNKVIAIGEIVWDCFPSGKRLGGAPLNFAFYAKQLGAESYAISAVGKDELGDETLSVAADTGVCPDYVQRNTFPTSRVLVTLNGAGIPQYEIVEGVAWDAIDVTEDALKLLSDASVVCWGSLAQRSAKSCESILALIDAAPETCLKVFDINIRQHFYSREMIEASLTRANILKLNEDELPLLAELLGVKGDEKKVVSNLVESYSLEYLIYTHGADFSEVYSADGACSHIPTPKVQVADTVGAGDSFTAVFVMSLLSGKSVMDSHASAVEVAAFVCTQNGAINALPEHIRAEF